MLNFFRDKWPYFLGFAILEGLMYYLQGLRGNAVTGIAGMFVIWMFYSWTVRNQPNDFANGPS